VFIFKHTAIFLGLTLPLIAQSPTSTSGTPQFEVASVKPNKSGDSATSANVSMGPGTAFVPTGGRFTAINFPLITNISFAYKVLPNQATLLLHQLPEWVTTDRFDIEARAEGNPAKDELRLMMQSLLADRFKLAIHNEVRQVPVFALVLSKAGKTGPGMQPHPDDSSCMSNPPPDELNSRFPALCGGIVVMPHPPVFMNKYGGRNVTMAFLANSFKGIGHLDRPVIDQTGLSGTWDFVLEWAPDTNNPPPPGADPQPEPSGPPFLTALTEQLGLKLETQKGPVDVLVLDHVEHPSGN
jgi:uncharacterized protein (TIGR03435 family)